MPAIIKIHGIAINKVNVKVLMGTSTAKIKYVTCASN
jgi:hypothetical protein